VKHGVWAAIFQGDTAGAKRAPDGLWVMSRWTILALAGLSLHLPFVSPVISGVISPAHAADQSPATKHVPEQSTLAESGQDTGLKASNSALSSSGISLGELRTKGEKNAKVIHASKAFAIGGGTVLTVVSAPEWSATGARLADLLKQSHGRFEKLFGNIPTFAVTLRLMDEESFFLSTGAPRWTNALFYRGQIIIPLSPTEQEYTHAVLHALTGGKAPGWIDEGLAQLAEGTENSALRPALYEYLRENPPVPFELMQGGFTRLETNMVAAAYAQSLIAAQALVETFGYERLGLYFSTLRSGDDHETAFSRVFGIREANFEDRFSRKLTRWANTYEVMNKPPGLQAVSNPGWADTDEEFGNAKARGFGLERAGPRASTDNLEPRR
jgi:hypothetical protein